jgi:rhodanese-related sulfurtransferase
MRSPKTIAVQELASLLSSQAPLLVVDLRKLADYRLDPRMLPGAVKRDLADVDSWGRALPLDRQIVVYCHQGQSVGTAAVEWLRTHGVAARQLEGGFTAWRDADLPLGRTQP